MIVDAPFPSVVTLSDATADRFDFARVALGESGTASAEFFGADFGAVGFAITLFLSGLIFY
jgi:hypothetical protein